MTKEPKLTERLIDAGRAFALAGLARLPEGADEVRAAHPWLLMPMTPEPEAHFFVKKEGHRGLGLALRWAKGMDIPKDLLEAAGEFVAAQLSHFVHGHEAAKQTVEAVDEGRGVLVVVVDLQDGFAVVRYAPTVTPLTDQDMEKMFLSMN